jgi:hypothetical protein
LPDLLARLLPVKIMQNDRRGERSGGKTKRGGEGGREREGEGYRERGEVGREQAVGKRHRKC